MISSLLRVVPWSWRNRIKDIPGLAQAQRLVFDAVLSGKEFVHLADAGPAKGVRFPVRMPEDKGIWTGTYESGFADELAAAVQPGMVTYDVGGWHGFFAGVMAARGAREVHVFEPLPESASRIEELIALNPQFAIRLHHCALGDEDGVTELLVLPASSMAKLASSTFQSDASVDDRIPTRFAKIDTLVATGELAPPNLIKIDVEGAESQVLVGAREVVQKYRPVIMAEIHSSILLEQCTAFFNDLGYTALAMDHSNQIMKQDMFHIVAHPN